MAEGIQNEKGPPRRVAAIEWAKLIAIIAVVYQHTVEGQVLRHMALLTDFAVPAFTVISCWYAVKSGNDLAGSGKRTGHVMISRAVSLYSLFLVWNTGVFLMRWLKINLVDGQAFPFDFDLFFWSGYGNALWYLPFLVLANAFSTVIGQATYGRKSVSNFVVLLLFVLVMVMFFSKIYWTYPVSNYGISTCRKALPAVFLATILFKSRGYLASWCSRKCICLLAFLTLFILSGFGIMYFHRNVVAWETIMGISFVGVFLSLLSLKWPVLDKNLSLWIYLAHAPLMQAGKDVLPFLGFAWPESMIVEIIVLFSIILVLYVLFRCINAFRITRKVLLQAN